MEYTTHGKCIPKTILRRYVEWDMYESKVGLISMLKPVVAELFKKTLLAVLFPEVVFCPNADVVVTFSTETPLTINMIGIEI